MRRMANKYCNLDGSKKIKDEYQKINIGFDKVEEDVNKINDDINTLDERVDTIITTPVEDVSAEEIIDARGGNPTLGKRFENIETAIEELDGVKDELDEHKAENTTDAHLPKNVGLGNVLNIKQVQIIEAKHARGDDDVTLNIPTERGVYFFVAMGNASNTPQIFEMFYENAVSRVSIIEPKNATIVFDRTNKTITISPTIDGWTAYSIVRLY